MFLEKISRSWEFAKISYGTIWHHKQLVIFPILSTTAAIIVSLSFILPAWGMGTLEQLTALMDDEAGSNTIEPVVYVLAFLFYFCNYFVIIFFNSALTACATQVVNREIPSVGYGLSVAVKRIPQILAWAVVSAIVGVLLKVIENSHDKAGKFISMVLGSAWTALTYFVIPAIVVEGLGPVDAFKSSVSTLKDTWGEALVGGFSMGFISFLITLPAILLAGVIIFLGVSSGSTVLLAAGIAAAVLLFVVLAAVSSAADVVFTALLYNFATGRMIPEGIDTSAFSDAFQDK